MEAIILVGGLGTRLRSVVFDIPKPMAPVNGRPFLEILLIDLKKKGFNKVILCVGYLKEKIIEYFLDCSVNIDIEFSIENEPLGTGGAIKKAIIKCSKDHVFVLNGDTFQDFDPRVMNNLWLTHQAPIILLRCPQGDQRYGGVSVNGQEVVNFAINQGNSHSYINAGIYILPKNIFEKYQAPDKFSIEEFFKENVDTLKIRYAVAKNGTFRDIGTPNDYKKFISK